MKKIMVSIFVLLFLLLPVTQASAATYTCPTGATNNGDGTCSIFLVASDDDTIVQTSSMMLPTYSRMDSDWLDFGNGTGVMGRTMVHVSYVEWNLSSLPSSGWTISSVKFLYEGGDVQDENGLVTEIGAVTIQPSVPQDPEFELAELFDNILNSTTKYVTPWAPIVAPDQEQNLGQNAVTDLQNSLAQGWFAIGIGVDTPGGGMNNYSSILGLLYAEPVADPQPTLEVVYTAHRLPELPDSGVSVVGTVISGGFVVLALATLIGAQALRRHYV